MLKLYKLSQTVNNEYDTFESCIVCAASPEEAKLIHPRKSLADMNVWWKDPYAAMEWAHPNDITVLTIGNADSQLRIGVVLASFKRG